MLVPECASETWCKHSKISEESQKALHTLSQEQPTRRSSVVPHSWPPALSWVRRELLCAVQVPPWTAGLAGSCHRRAVGSLVLCASGGPSSPVASQVLIVMATLLNSTDVLGTAFPVRAGTVPAGFAGMLPCPCVGSVGPNSQGLPCICCPHLLSLGGADSS